MAMTILNNTASMMTLGELNKNITKVGKDLAKVSSGKRLPNFGAGASDLAISEKMKARIRGLYQCNQNTKTGRSMVEVASGGVREQLEALKKMREIALRSSDDTFTDKDREVLQAEVRHLLQEVDDIAEETNYNGKPLLNGVTGIKQPITVYDEPYETYDPITDAHENTQDIIVDNTNGQYPNSTEVHQVTPKGQEYLPPGAICYGPDTYGYVNDMTVYDANIVLDNSGTQYSTTPIQSTSGVNLLAATDGANTYILVDDNGNGFNYDNPTTKIPSTDFPQGIATLVPSGYAVSSNPQLGDKVCQYSAVGSNLSTVKTEDFSNRLIVSPYDTLGGAYSSYKLDFPALGGLNLPGDLKDQGMTILCERCPQFVSIRFDTTQPIGSVAQIFYNGDDPVANNTDEPFAYSVGVSDVTNANDLAKALFEGIKALNGTYGGNDKVLLANHHKIGILQDGNDYYLIKGEKTSWWVDGPPLAIYNGVAGEFITHTPEHTETIDVLKPYQDFRIQGETKASMYTNLRFPNTTTKILFPPIDSKFDLDPDEKDYPNPWPQEYLEMSDIDKKYYDNKYECEGDEEKIRREKWRDEFWPYPRKGAVASEECVRNKDNAKKFIADVDNAIKYILDTSTTFGSYSMRMTIMNNNIVSNHENTTAAESTISDADMAKEMTSFTKNNVLAQASQAMLAQANQHGSSVLNLLQ